MAGRSSHGNQAIVTQSLRLRAHSDIPAALRLPPSAPQPRSCIREPQRTHRITPHSTTPADPRCTGTLESRQTTRTRVLRPHPPGARRTRQRCSPLRAPAPSPEAFPGEFALFGFGPETITISQRFPGTYVYAVHRFSDDPPTLAGARVEVFDSAGLISTFTRRAKAGECWPCAVSEYGYGLRREPVRTTLQFSRRHELASKAARRTGSDLG